ncbi:hypothetical protein EW146_g7958 [Bondarzewia mesenterica]|uniref:Uncharacterized protein n=1 Tax=Bondarzewia mesenterica TaxID=1095465 RepID=A0A4S4LIR9_9AGAM|nr:hypothetical protein EW146_g7958 [Bondarzewia mesenterica]
MRETNNDPTAFAKGGVGAAPRYNCEKPRAGEHQSFEHANYLASGHIQVGSVDRLDLHPKYLHVMNTPVPPPLRPPSLVHDAEGFIIHVENYSYMARNPHPSDDEDDEMVVIDDQMVVINSEDERMASEIDDALAAATIDRVGSPSRIQTSQPYPGSTTFLGVSEGECTDFTHATAPPDLRHPHPRTAAVQPPSTLGGSLGLVGWSGDPPPTDIDGLADEAVSPPPDGAPRIPNYMQLLKQSVAEAVIESMSTYFKEHRTNIGGGYQADSEEDNEGKISERKPSRRKGPRGLQKTTLDDAFRVYLRAKGILPKPGQLPPPMADQSTVDVFEVENGPPPDISVPLLNWEAPLMSPWNSEVIFLLAHEFLGQVKEGDHLPVIYDSETMTVRAFSTLCWKKLARTRSDYRLRVSASQSAEAQTLIESRQERLQAQLRKCARRSGGMSDDETESEEIGRQRRAKWVQRVALNWLSISISLLWGAVETYNDAKWTWPLKRGNKPYDHIFDALVADGAREAVHGLPFNFYNTIWWRSLSEWEKHLMDPQPAVEILSLKKWVSKMNKV